MKRLALVPLLLLLGAWDPITKKQADVAGGNESLKSGKPDEAEERYRRALAELPGAPAVLYNLGTAQVQRAAKLPLGDERSKLIESAEKMLREAGDAADMNLRASSHYNLGNAFYAEKKYKDAIDEYKKALRIEPAREDARHNLELALSRLPAPRPDPQQQPGKQGSDDDPQQQGAKGDPTSNDQQDKKDDEQKQAGDPREQNPSDAAQDQTDSQAQAQPADQQEGKDSGQAPSKPADDKAGADQKRAQASSGERSSDRDMNQKLDLLEESSKNLQVQRAQERARERRRGRPAKDW